MPSSYVVPISVVRQIVKAAIDESNARARIPAILSGAVEDLDVEDRDVAYVRMDAETMGSDPTQSDNWDAPGIVYTTRLGATQIGEQVRVSFDGTAGGSASLTAAPNSIVLPFGQETGNRIVLDGEQGLIIIGDPGPDAPGARIELDPVGGIRIRSHTDVLVGIIDQQGYTLRDNATGLAVGELATTGDGHSRFRLIDPEGTDDIEMTTSSTGSLPNPKYDAATNLGASSTITTPTSPTFTSNPPDDIDIYHAATGNIVSQANTFTPPAGTTERVDTVHNTGTATLAVGLATRDPADGTAGTFTSSTSNWSSRIGTHVVVKGGGTVSPSFRSVAEANFGPLNDASTSATVPKPAGTVAGDVMLAFVSMYNAGGSVPTGWTTPDGWVFLGADYRIVGTTGTVAAGVWAKLAGSAEPSDYTIDITFTPGSKRLHAAIVTIQNPALIAGGAHIRMSGHPIRRLLAQNTLTAASATLCDFQSVPGGYDHLELVYDIVSGTSTDVLRNVRMRFNADGGAGSYRWQVTRDNVISGSTAGTQDRMIIGAIDGSSTGSTAGGRLNMLGYTRPNRRMVLGDSFFVTAAGGLVQEFSRALWLNVTDPINRVGISVDAGTTVFGIGSRAYLYGY